MTDPLTILGLSYAGKEGLAVVAQFVRDIFGPSAKALGEGIAAPIEAWRERRDERARRVVVDAAQRLDVLGIPAKPVPGEILVPLLQAASMTDEPALQEKWSGLLSSAARADGMEGDIIPGFVDILRQLTPVQAAILDWMYGQKTEPVPGWVPHWPDVGRNDIENRFSLTASQYALLITDMERLQLIEPRRDIKPNTVSDEVPIDQMMNLIVGRWNSRVKYDFIGFTPLGIQFIKACAGPVLST